MTVSLFFSLAGFVIVILFCLFAGAYLKRRTGQDRILAEFREEVNKLIAAIDDATDRDALLVEERVKSLKALLADVDKRMGVYAREMDRRRVQERAYAGLGKTHWTEPSARESPPVEKKTEDGKGPVLPQKAEEGPPEAEEKNSPAPGELEPPSAPRFIQAAREIKPKPLPLKEQVEKLAREGFSANVIAARLGVSISEVELALAIAKL
jgi:hypothetical protein